MLGGGYGGLLGLHRRLALGHPRAGRSDGRGGRGSGGAAQLS